LGKSATSNRYYQLFSWSPWDKVHINHVVWYVATGGFWDILSYLAKFRVNKCSKSGDFQHFLQNLGIFPKKSPEIMLFSCRMKQKWTKKMNNTIFDLFIWPKIKMFRVCLKYVIITDILRFEAFPNVQNWVKIYWNLLLLLNCVRKQVYFKKIVKNRILGKVRFFQMSTLQPTVHSGPKQQFRGHLVIPWTKYTA